MIAELLWLFIKQIFPGKFTGISVVAVVVAVVAVVCFIWRGMPHASVGQRSEFMALCGLLAQFLNAQFQCLMHISTCTTIIVIGFVIVAFVVVFNCNHLVLFHFSVCFAWMQFVIKLNCQLLLLLVLLSFC